MPPDQPRGRMRGQPLSAGAPPPIDLSAVAHVPADNRGKRIGVLVVAYNAATTQARVLERIPPDVWANVEEVVVFDDASKDDTYERGVDYKAISGIEHLTILKNERNLGYGGNQKLGF